MRFQTGMTGFCLTLALMLPGCGGETDVANSAAVSSPADAGIPAPAMAAALDAVPDMPDMPEFIVPPSEDAQAIGLRRPVRAQYADLQRFVTAQESAGPDPRTSVYEDAVRELNKGEKESHWMWYIFPQPPLGTTRKSLDYAIQNLDQAQRYLADPELGDRLRKCFDTVLLPKHSGKSAEDIFGTPLDAKKFQSSATLFQQACAGSMDPKDDCFQQVLKTFYKGEAHEKTLKFLQAQSQGSA